VILTTYKYANVADYFLPPDSSLASIDPFRPTADNTSISGLQILMSLVPGIPSAGIPSKTDSYLRAVLPESDAVELSMRVCNMMEPVGNDARMQLLSFVIYMISNDLMESDNCSMAMQCFANWEYKPLLVSLLSSETPTVRVFAEHLLETGLRMQSKEIIQAALSAGVMPDRVCHLKWRYYTPLEYASECCTLHIVKILLDAGADVNAPPADKSGKTALAAAAGRGHIGLCQTLLDAGADVNAPPADEEGKTAL
jgi:Ankyrin repeats (3 copies)